MLGPDNKLWTVAAPDCPALAIYLRMQHAANLLVTTEDKVEVIARACGYENPFVFSTSFKKWVGWRPSEYRARKW